MKLLQKQKVLDVPNHRSSHHIAKPTSAGIVILTLVSFYVFAFSSFSQGFYYVLAIMIGMIGFFDDFKPLSNLYKLNSQITVSLLLVVTLETATRFSVFSYQFGFISAGLVLLLLFVWWINVYNFMDGIDGIAASQAIYMIGILFIYQAMVGVIDNQDILLVLLACLFAFMLFNWAPSKVFMGDSGSLFIGFFLLIMHFQNHDVEKILPLFLISASLFLCDSTVTLLRRLFQRKKITSAHREHLYQIAAQYFNSHAAIVIAFISVNILVVTPVFLYAVDNPEHSWTSVFLLYGVLCVFHTWCFKKIKSRTPAD